MAGEADREMPFDGEAMQQLRSTVELLTDPDTPRPARQAIMVCLMADRIPMDVLEEYRRKLSRRETTMPLLDPSAYQHGGADQLDRALARLDALIEFKEALPQTEVPHE